MFCEGTQDVVFVERSLGACANCERLDRPIRELPSPFGASRTVPTGLIARRFQEFAVEDLALQDEYPPTPQFESIVADAAKNVMFVLIRVGGKHGTEAVLRLVRYVDALMGAGAFEVTEHAVAFLFDANDEGIGATTSRFRSAYGSYYGALDGATHARWVATDKVPVGLYVFCANGGETGTLEHHVAPMVAAEWPERYNAAQEFIDGNSRPVDAIANNDSRRLKAVITAAGQFDHPGRPLATILARKGLPKEQYRLSSAANDLASFLLATPWQSAGRGSAGAMTGVAQGIS